MGEVASGGRTVLFVSHNMGAVRALTNHSVLLQNGSVVSDGATADIIQQYVESTASLSLGEARDLRRRSPNHGIRVRIERIDPVYDLAPGYFFSEPITLNVAISSKIELPNPRFGMTVMDMTDSPILTVFSPEFAPLAPSDREHTWQVRIEDHRLAPGEYQLALSVFSGGEGQARIVHDLVRPGTQFTVLALSRDGSPVYKWDQSYGPIAHQECTVARVG